MSSAALPPDRAPARRSGTFLAALVAAILAALWIPTLSRAQTWGWDESMHAELPALRILLALKSGEIGSAFDALLDCAQYPFGYPLVLAFSQAIFGVGEATCRATGTAIWCIALLGLYLLGRQIAGDDPKRRLAPWIAMALGALSPMALAFAGTLFLEIPFACASIFALRAWLRRRSEPSPKRELAAGAWIAVCLFTKWNYGLLLASGLALDWIWDLVRGRDRRAFLTRSLRLALVPGIALAWWFLIPIPGGAGVAADHRAALLDFLGGNRGFARTPASVRALHGAAWLSISPRMLLLVVAATLASLRSVRRPEVRTLWLVLLATTLPVLAHPFHQDRFLLPLAVAGWTLAGVGLASCGTAAVLALVAAAVVFPMWDTAILARSLGYGTEYQLSVFRGWKDLSGSRPLPTSGLARAEADALLDLAARAVGPDARVGWIGISNELSPAVVQIGLLERGGSRARFLRDATKPMDVTYFGVDPVLDDAAFAHFAEGFDVICSTEPADLRGRPARAFEGEYRRRLVERLGWTAEELGRVPISRPLQPPLPVTLLACRPKR